MELKIGDVVEIVEVGGGLMGRLVTFTRQDAQAMLDDTFAEADTTSDPSLTVTSDDEALAIAQTEIKAHRNSSKPQKP